MKKFSRCISFKLKGKKMKENGEKKEDKKKKEVAFVHS